MNKKQFILSERFYTAPCARVISFCAQEELFFPPTYSTGASVTPAESEEIISLS